MLDKIKALLQEVENMKAANAEELEALRIKYLSKKGEISALMNDFRNVAADQKREVGKYLNELKETTQSKINELKESFENVQTANDDIDLTRTAYPIELGTRHPLSLVKKEICDIFGGTGNRGRLACLLFLEFRRGPSCPRYARYVLYPA